MLEVDLQLLEAVEALPVMGTDGAEPAPLPLVFGQVVTAEGIAHGVRGEGKPVLSLKVMCQADAPEVGLLSLLDHQALHISGGLSGTAAGAARASLETRVVSMTTDPLPHGIAGTGELSGRPGEIVARVRVELQEHTVGQALVNGGELGVGERDHVATSVANW